jgi:hypothetical protein
MPRQPNHFIKLKVTKNALIDEWHVSKIYKHMFNYESPHMNKSELNLV